MTDARELAKRLGLELKVPVPTGEVPTGEAVRTNGEKPEISETYSDAIDQVLAAQSWRVGPSKLQTFYKAVGAEVNRALYRDLARLIAEAAEVEAREGKGGLLTGKDLLDLPDPSWALRGLLPDVGVAQVFGPSRAGKSFLVLDQCLAVANGHEDWFGFQVDRPGHAVYVALEGGFDLKWRVQSWLAAHPKAGVDRFLARVEQPLDLGSRASVRRLATQVREALPDDGELVLLVVDTQGKATPGREENSNTAMNEVMGNCHQLAVDLGCCVELVHHSGWDEGRERGASAQRGALDALVRVQPGVFTVTKVKAGPDGQERHFELAEQGRSLVARPLDAASAVARQADRRLGVQGAVLEYVVTHPGLQRTQVYEGVGGQRRDLVDAVNALLSGGQVEVRTEGRRQLLYPAEA